MTSVVRFVVFAYCGDPDGSSCVQLRNDELCAAIFENEIEDML